MRLGSMLEAGRRDFLEAAEEISVEQAGVRSSNGGWSALECIEHVILFEDRYLSWIVNGAAIPSQRDAERETRLFTMIRSRLTKMEAPEALRPCGRFDSLAAALAEFHAARDRSVQVAQECGDALYSLGTKHPHFGNVNGAELLQLVDGHARRHADQIREIAEAIAADPRRPVKAKPRYVFGDES